MTAPVDLAALFNRNRDLALDESDAMDAAGRSGLAQYAQGQAQAYAEAARIVRASTANLRTPAGVLHCSRCAPDDVELAITEHDDQRAVAE
jgi:hypothetical protein